MKAFFNDTDLPKVNVSTKLIATHVPLSCSVVSNVPGFIKPKCFVNERDPRGFG